MRRPLSFILAVSFGLSALAQAESSGAKELSLLSYEQLSRLDFGELKKTLEEAGWPAAQVRAFVGQEIQSRLNPPEIARAEDFQTFEFWRTGPDAEALPKFNTSELQAKRRQREEAARKEFEALFPATEPEESKLVQAWEEQRKWGNLPASKREAVSHLLSAAAKERDGYLNARGGMLNGDELNHLADAAKRVRERLATLLTPEELLDYDLRNSETAAQMRGALDNFKPTKAEFLAIFKLRHPIELEFDAFAVGASPEILQRRTNAEAQAEKAIATALGPQRYDDYRLSLEPACQTLQFDGRFAHADATIIRQLYRRFLAAKADYDRAAALPADQQDISRRKIKAEIYSEFRRVFDEEGTRRYLQEQGLWP